MDARRLALVAALAGLSCPAAEVTFTRDVAPILYKRCVNCHRPGDIAPMSLLTYKDARPWAAAIKEAVLTRKMPPWKADPHVGAWSNDPSLTHDEVGILTAWADGSKAEGDPKAMPPAPVFADGWKIGKPDVIFTIPESTLDPKGSGPDQHITVVVPTNFSEDMWVAAAELRPGNRKIVHHAHVFLVEPGPKPVAKGAAKDPAVEYARSLMVHEGTESWVKPDAPVIDNGCAIDDNGEMPGTRRGDLSLISSYLPGRAPDVYPAGTARRIPAGSSLSFQIHYSRTTGKPETDATAVGLVFAKEPPRQVARRLDFGNHLFLIPANDPNHEVSECHRIEKDIYITSLTPHMHLRGKSMKISAVFPDAHRETLLDVPAYNFHWQITYRTAKPIFLPKGTRIEIVAHFDNSRNNPLNPDPTRPVRWGSESETEMMDGWVEYVDAETANLSASSR